VEELVPAKQDYKEIRPLKVKPSDLGTLAPLEDTEKREADDEIDELFTSPFSFQDFAPLVFHKIRHLCGINTSDYLKALKPNVFLANVMKNQKFSEGRSGSFFCFSPTNNSSSKPFLKASSRCLEEYCASIISI